jgi:hypothetical protein
MEFVFTVALTAGLFLAIALLWFPPSWLAWAEERIMGREPVGDVDEPVAAVRVGEGPGEGLEMTVNWGLFPQAFVRRRLDALAEELERLDRDPDVFAKAFHTTVARSAYEALLVDASKLSDQPWRPAGPMIDFEVLEVLGTSTGLREELEL